MKMHLKSQSSFHFRLFVIVIYAVILAGCRISLSEPFVTPTWTYVPPHPSPTISVMPINTIAAVGESLFISQYCPLSVIPENGWSVQEYGPGEPGSFSMDVSLIEIIKDEFRLTIVCQIGNGDTIIGPGGLPAGENINLPETIFLDKFVPGKAIVWEDAIKTVIYTYQSEFLRIIVNLGSNPDPSNPIPYDEFEISQETLNEVADILETLSLTESLESTAVTTECCDPPAILPMDEYYHSQIQDTDLPNACAPTAGFMVLEYLKREISLDKVAELLMMVEPEHGGYDPSCQRNVVCTSPMTLAQQISFEYGLTIFTRQGWSLEATHNALSRGHPIVADILYRLNGKGLGHFVVIFGVDLEKELIYYHDPIDGKNLVSTWQVFSERWAGPVDIGDPTYPQGFRFWGMEVYSEERIK